jgi:hypothetical protein
MKLIDETLHHAALVPRRLGVPFNSKSEINSLDNRWDLESSWAEDDKIGTSQNTQVSRSDTN